MKLENLLVQLLYFRDEATEAHGVAVSYSRLENIFG